MKPVIGIVADLHTGSKHATTLCRRNISRPSLPVRTPSPLILPALIARPGAAWTGNADLEDALSLLDGLFLPGGRLQRRTAALRRGPGKPRPRRPIRRATM